MISERILGISHKDTVFRYMYAGASYADTNQVGQFLKVFFYFNKRGSGNHYNVGAVSSHFDSKNKGLLVK